MNKSLYFTNVVVFVLMLVLNYLSATGWINDESQATISARYYNLFVPAGYAFSIWGLIYLSIAGYLAFEVRKIFTSVVDDPAREDKTGWLLLFANLFIAAWLFLWSYHFIGWALVAMAGILVSLIGIMHNERIALDDEPLKRFVFNLWPFSLFTGWISVAFIANAAAWGTKLGLRETLNETAWAVAAIGLAALLNIFIVRFRNARLFSLVGVWALIAIASARFSEGNEVIGYTAALAAGLVFIHTAVHGFMNRKKSPFRKEMLR